MKLGSREGGGEIAGFVSCETTDSSYSHSVAAYPHDNPTSLPGVNLNLNNPRNLL